MFTNQPPIFIPKGQKADIFINAKEAHQLNSFGYFGNDYFYLKIYKIVKASYENYKVCCRLVLLYSQLKLIDND